MAQYLLGKFVRMSRPSRKAVLGDGRCTVHLVIRAHNRAHLFRDDAVKEELYRLLLRFKREHKILLHHYVFMDNHVHLVLYLEETKGLSDFMREVFGRLGRFINKRSGRSGRVFGERARTPVIQDRRYLFAVMRYIDQNPVRAGITKKAHQYRWSSFRHYAFGESDELIDDAPDYLELSPVAARRRLMYLEMLGQVIGRGERPVPEYTTWYFIGDEGWKAMMFRMRGLRRAERPPG